MRQFIRKWIPSEERVRAHPSLRWMAPLLRRPWLWHLSRRSVALGAGLGVFFGFLIPVLQILGAAIFAVLLRANLPVAAAATLVSNPLTYAPIFVLAYRTGAVLLGEPVEPAQAHAWVGAADAEDDGSWVERAKAIGKPLFLGLAVFAVVGGLLAWAAVHLLWTLAVWWRRRRGAQRRRSPPPPAPQ
jgi:uncharacterized protein (DUF2062 family)